MNPQPAPAKIHLSNTPDYREAYANSVQVRVSLWDFFLLFGTINQNTPDSVTIHNHQGIFLSPQQAKALANVLESERQPVRSHLRRNPPGAEAARLLRSVGRRVVSRRASHLIFFFAFAAILLAMHLPLLTLPFHWDEMGQFVPAALDLYRDGAWVPHSTLPNVHPPGVMLVLAVVWKIFGYSILSARLTMLAIATVGVYLRFCWRSGCRASRPMRRPSRRCCF